MYALLTFMHRIVSHRIAGGSCPFFPLETSSLCVQGGFRGTLNGFLLGFGLVSAGGAAWVLQSQRQAAETVSATAAQLQRDTATLAEHMDKVHRLETELAVLKGVSIPRSEQQGRKDALEQLYQGVREDLDTAVTRLSHVGMSQLSA